jgi:predicted transcriptional regulator of viral defense system
MNKRHKLFEIADRQQGYFTTKQAEECGVPRSHFYRKLQSGEWIKDIRGIYHLAQYPVSNRPELVLWTLWSRDKQGQPQGVWSHETALDIHDLSDVMPSKMHMTVPQGFRRSIEIPKNLKLHFAILSTADIEIRQGYRVTTPLRTLLDIIEAGTVSQEHVGQAIREGLRRGTLSLREVNETAILFRYKRECKI